MRVLIFVRQRLVVLRICWRSKIFIDREEYIAKEYGNLVDLRALV